MLDRMHARSSTDWDPYFAMDVNNGWVAVTWIPYSGDGIVFDINTPGIFAAGGKCSNSNNCVQAWGPAYAALVQAKIKRYAADCISYVQFTSQAYSC